MEEQMDQAALEQPINIHALLVAKNIKQIDLARKYFITPSELNRVIKGKRRTHYIRQAIAMELGMPIEELWPPE